MAFLDENFLLKTPAARILYHDYAADMPILDYHCHLSPKEIYENRSFSNIAQVWLGGDHYKWRLLRAGGVEEKYITGDASDREKFQKYAEVLSRAIGNPLYHWSHLELRRYFGYEGVLNEDTAQEVWELCNQKLQFLLRRIELLTMQSCRGRVIAHLLAGQDRNGCVKPTGSREDLARQLGVSRAALFRELAALQSMGVLRSEGNLLTVLDTPALEKLLYHPSRTK